MSELLRIEERGDVALVTIDRPPANAMDRELLEAGHAVLGDLAARDPAAVVLAGREGFFSAGSTSSWPPPSTRRASGPWSRHRPPVRRLVLVPAAGRRGGHRPRDRGRADPRPVRRLARGGDQGEVWPTELRAGIPYPAVAMLGVRAELEPAVARRLVLRAELLEPAAALAAGLFDELAEPAAVVPRALEVAAELAALPRGAYLTIKRQLRGDTIEAMRQALDGEDPMSAAGWLDEETAGAAALTLRGD